MASKTKQSRGSAITTPVASNVAANGKYCALKASGQITNLPVRVFVSEKN